MKAALLVGIVTVTMPLCAQVSNSSSPASPTNVVASTQPALQAAAATVLSAELTRGLDARKVRVGDPVFAKCTQDLNENGEALIPRNTKLVGHVVTVQTKGRGQPESQLAIAFDKAIMRDGREVPITASIQAVAPPAILENELSPQDIAARKASPTPQSAGLFPGTIKSLPAESYSTSSAHVLSTTAAGTVGLKGIQLEPAAPAAATSVIHSNSQNVRLESGTRLILRVSLP